jgi:hypothetical protein
MAPKFCSGLNSEIITLESLCSGDERKAVLICCQISGVLSSQFGQESMFKQMQVFALAPQIHWILPTLICIRLMELEALSKCAGRSPGPGLKGTAE